MTTLLDDHLGRWLDMHAEALDSGAGQAHSLLLPMLAASGLARMGVPESDGGTGGKPSAAIDAVAALAERSLSAAFVFWAQRAVIECLVHSPNRPLVQRLLPSLLDGSLAGAPGLSNAMKFLGGLDQMHLHFAADEGASTLDGTIGWATNLRKQGFVAVAGARNKQNGHIAIFAIPGDVEGVSREPDFDLVALRGTNTAGVRLTGAALDDGWCLHPDAGAFLQQIRPALLAMQCGLGLGLARASLRSVREAGAKAPAVLLAEADTLHRSIAEYWAHLAEGIDTGRLREQKSALISMRLGMVELAMSAAQLELQALGGSSYLRGKADGFMRRWREAAFLPIVTPTALQLKTELSKQN